MASGSSGRVNPGGSKGFDFGSSDDILCSYEDYENQDSSNGRHSDPVISSNSVKDFHKSRMTRPSAFPATYEHSEDSLHQEVVSTVERAMKRHTDGVMRFLEGISSRLSQLELYCYNVDKSIGEMRSELARDHAEADSKLKAVEKHLQEVHRSVQILRDKQELADTQKELAKLHTAQKESSSSSHSQSNDEKAAPTSDTKKAESTPEPNNQLALALPHQVAPQQQQPPALPPSTQTVPQNVMQQQPYYMSPPQLPAPPPPTQHQQGQYLAADSQYRPPQMQDISRVTPQAPQAQVNQPLPGQQYPNYQQQWSQQMQPPQAPLQTPHMRPQPTSYPAYPPSCQPANPSPQETMPTSMAPQLSYSGIPQPMSSRADALPYGYGAGRTVPQQPPPQQVKGTYGVQPGDGYSPAGPHPAPPPGSTYMMYDTEGRPSHFAQAVYPSPNLSLQTSQPGPGGNMSNRTPSHPQFIRSHPYNDLIEKLVSMGFRGDHVVSIIQRMEENGQPVDFNSVLDRLSSQTSGGSQRGWSG